MDSKIIPKPKHRDRFLDNFPSPFEVPPKSCGQLPILISNFTQSRRPKDTRVRFLCSIVLRDTLEKRRRQDEIFRIANRTMGFGIFRHNAIASSRCTRTLNSLAYSLAKVQPPVVPPASCLCPAYRNFAKSLLSVGGRFVFLSSHAFFLECVEHTIFNAFRSNILGDFRFAP